MYLCTSLCQSETAGKLCFGVKGGLLFKIELKTDKTMVLL